MDTQDKLRLFIKENFKTIKKFAEKTGYKNPNQLQEYLNKKEPIKPGWTLLSKLLNVGCDLNWLVSESDDAKQDERAKVIRELRKEVKELRSQLKEIRETANKFK